MVSGFVSGFFCLTEGSPKFIAVSTAFPFRAESSSAFIRVSVAVHGVMSASRLLWMGGHSCARVFPSLGSVPRRTELCTP